MPLPALPRVKSANGGSLFSKLFPRPGHNSRNRTRTTTASEKDSQRVWILKDGKPMAVAVKVGDSDGQMSQLVSDELKEGLAVIIDAATARK